MTCAKSNSSDSLFTRVKPAVKKVDFSELEIYTNYSCRVRAVNNFGNGTWSEVVTASTDEGSKSLVEFGILLDSKLVVIRGPEWG